MLTASASEVRLDKNNCLVPWPTVAQPTPICQFNTFFKNSARKLKVTWHYHSTIIVNNNSKHWSQIWTLSFIWPWYGTVSQSDTRAYYTCVAGLLTQALNFAPFLPCYFKIFVENKEFSRPTNLTFGAVWNRNGTLIFVRPNAAPPPLDDGGHDCRTPGELNLSHLLIPRDQHYLVWQRTAWFSHEMEMPDILFFSAD